MSNLKANYITVFIIFLFGNITAQEFTTVLNKKIDTSIAVAFNVDAHQLEPIEISDDINKVTKAEFSNNLFKINNNIEQLGYAYVGQGRSMKDVFDYVILFDKNLIIKKAKVLIYRETYGTQIGTQRWLKQFIGKSSNDTLHYGTNIVAISGATISASSMSSEVNDVLSSIKILLEKSVL